MRKKNESELLKELKSERHSWELPLYASLIVFNIAIAVNIIIVASLSDLFNAFGLSYSGPFSFIASLSLGWIAIPLIFIPSLLVVPLFRGAYYAYVSAFGIKATKENFKELMWKGEEIASSLGMKKCPEIFIINKKGFISSKSSKAIRKPFIVISYELLESAYSSKDNDFSTSYFALSREMAHLALGHKSFRLSFLTLLSRFIPILGPALYRSFEYSADKGAAIILKRDVSKSFTSYIVGGKLYKSVNAKSAAKERTGGLTHGAFSRFIYNLFAWMPTKIERLRALEGDKDGAMFL